jgi:hypothetical protein
VNRGSGKKNLGSKWRAKDGGGKGRRYTKVEEAEKEKNEREPGEEWGRRRKR